MDKTNIESKLIKENWGLIGSTFDKTLKEFRKCKQKADSDDQWKYSPVIDILLEEWIRIYPGYVLLPICQVQGHHRSPQEVPENIRNKGAA